MGKLELGSGEVLRAMKVCMKPGCNNLTRDGYCEVHKQQETSEQQKKYDRMNRNQKARDFYKSKEWFKARSKRMKIDFGLCVKCKQEGRLTHANVVHHKEELLKAWDKRVDIDNLECLCHACHNKVHGK